jgi:hypothetical protein
MMSMLELCQVIKCLIQLDFLQMTVTRETKFFFYNQIQKDLFRQNFNTIISQHFATISSRRREILGFNLVHSLVKKCRLPSCMASFVFFLHSFQEDR